MPNFNGLGGTPENNDSHFYRKTASLFKKWHQKNTIQVNHPDSWKNILTLLSQILLIQFKKSSK